ncbi:hypothetical protein IWQ47_002196 [Aquimarina sp. EL_43]|uniref:hypothetical protein n=1 Tax=unclassified Aquimarina TaxID=2627091 RepID=UPI0018CA59CB|nr:MULTISPECIES: hypothetical protein [unclassified Aquimarina]MBG6130732.1 hypothetical protein [Aquimarina sp. EL_35]MBG6151121.1 hypothetical protein [Aquimarina sp. EL_32]MBG6169122.1 hypothetical protein [Aquimarina sp. EL_43]
MMKYISDRRFKLWAYSIGHGSMIIRSEMQYPDVEYTTKYDPNCTIDIEFWGVRYLDIKTDFSNLVLSQELSNIPKRFLSIISEEDLKVFKLESSNETNYVVAAGCLVGKSMWTNEDRLHNIDLSYQEELFNI